jgi:phosphoribosylformylglycinamidine synthase
MASKPKALIITGYGLNCEAESRFAWEQAGADTDLVHLRDLLEKPARLHEAQVLMFIGGFSFGDHMGSGHVFAARLRHHLCEDLQTFIDAGKLVLGVCNGFQIMAKLGLLPGLDGEFFSTRVALIQNDVGAFQNRWVHVRYEENSPSVFTKGLGVMPLPIRHGEGKLFTPDKELLARIEDEHCVACRYVDPATGEPAMAFPLNPNGSLNAIAGLNDPSGRILGMMPHPEAFLFPQNHPQWDAQKVDGKLPEYGDGLKLFRNAVGYLARS